MKYFLHYWLEDDYRYELDSFDNKDELLTFLGKLKTTDFTIIKGCVIEAVPVEKVISYEIKEWFMEQLKLLTNIVFVLIALCVLYVMNDFLSWIYGWFNRVYTEEIENDNYQSYKETYDIQ